MRRMGLDWRSATPPPTDDQWAKLYCASCPVAVECLHEAIVTNEEYGIRALGLQGRRALRRVWLSGDPVEYAAKLHEAVDRLKGADDRPWQEMRRCERCEASGISNGWVPAGRHPEDQNGPNAQCGKAVTYARGCRCWHCKLARSLRLTPQRTEEEEPQGDRHHHVPTCATPR